MTALACGPERAVLLTSRAGERRQRRKTARRSPYRGVRVGSVRVGSPADRAGLAAADMVVQIDGRPIHDFLDFYVASFGPRHEIKVLRGGESLSLSLVRSRTEDAGAELTPDRLRACNNRCIFCFVDQLPQGLRRELYFKDEDYRLSFLHGNYLTLTNLRPADERRIREEHLSPLYVSVHSTNEEVRRELLGRTPGEPVLRVLKRLARGGIRFHTQVVIVPGYNDGDRLTNTLRDLTGLGRAIMSVSVVPVGLTCHRGGLPRLRRLTRSQARAIAGQVSRLNTSLRQRTGQGMVYVSDELLILAGAPIPQANYYDDFPQIENGVGLVRQLLDQFKGLRVPASLRGKHVKFVTAELALPFVERLARRLRRDGLQVDAVAVKNTLLGPAVTVSGLLPGEAIIRRLRRGVPCDAVVLPPAVLNADDLTLDGVHISRIRAGLGVQVLVARYDLSETLKDLAAALGKDSI